MQGRGRGRGRGLSSFSVDFDSYNQQSGPFASKSTGGRLCSRLPKGLQVCSHESCPLTLPDRVQHNMGQLLEQGEEVVVEPAIGSKTCPTGNVPKGLFSLFLPLIVFDGTV